MITAQEYVQMMQCR